MKRRLPVGKRPAPALCAMIVFGGCVLLLITGCVKEKSWQIGLPAPEISCLDFHDRTVKLSAFRGKVVVLRSRATGCNGCIAGLPALDGYSKKYRERDLAVLAVNMGNPKQLVASFARDGQFNPQDLWWSLFLDSNRTPTLLFAHQEANLF